MDVLKKIMKAWEETLNADQELSERNKSTYSSIEGKQQFSLKWEIIRLIKWM